MSDFRKLKVIDPLLGKAEKQKESSEFSPMDPPDAFNPPNNKSVPIEEMVPFIRKLHADHEKFTVEIDKFEEVLIEGAEAGISKNFFKEISEFFRCFDSEILPHMKKEEKLFLPLLHKALLEHGEHSSGEKPITAAGMLEEEHLKSIQLAAIVFNLFALATRLPDDHSRLITMDMAIEQGKSLIEQLRLHMFREEQIAFVQAHELIDPAVWENVV